MTGIGGFTTADLSAEFAADRSTFPQGEQVAAVCEGPAPAGLGPRTPSIDGLSFEASLSVAHRDLICAARMLDNGEEQLEDGLRTVLESAGRLVAFFQPARPVTQVEALPLEGAA